MTSLETFTLNSSDSGSFVSLRSNNDLKTKDILAFDEGLADQQAPFVVVALPLLAALTALDAPEDEGAGPDPDTIKDYLEDALVLLGNAHVRLNN